MLGTGGEEKSGEGQRGGVRLGPLPQAAEVGWTAGYPCVCCHLAPTDVIASINTPISVQFLLCHDHANAVA